MHVIIIGCTHAGTAAAKTIRQLHPDARITIYERNDNISFLSCGIALHIGGVVADIDALFYASPQQLESLGIRTCMQHEVIDVDIAGKTLTVRDLTRENTRTDRYDKLVIATGSWPIRPDLEGIDLAGVMLAKNYDHARAIVQAQQTARRIAVVGAGYIGVELVEAFVDQGKQVTLIDQRPRIFARYFDEEFSAPIEALLRQRGVELALGQGVRRFTGAHGQVTAVETTHGGAPCDLAILCVGFRPVTELFRDKLATLANGALLVDDYMQTSQPDIFAAGDCCAVRLNPVGGYRYLPLATNAVRMGTLVARNLLQRTTRGMGTQGTSAIKVFGQSLAATGLTDDAAREEGFNAASVIITDSDRPEFMPSFEQVTLRVTYARGSGRLLGGQVASCKDCTQLMNTLSVAIQQNMTITELAFTDFFFLPHFNKPWNLLNIAALQAAPEETVVLA
jgi:NADPH-dependent 2,4-dienoyl-CoA reductase/sulfur reductase-like enzyme